MSKSHLFREDIAYANPIFYGSTFTEATLNAAITGLGTTPQTLFLPTQTWTLANNVTVPESLHLYVPAGSVLIVNGGVTLTINGPFTAPPVQVFSGTGAVVFGSRVDKVYPQWWGAKGDGLTDDTVPLQLACATGRHVWLPKGTYLHSAPLFCVSGTTLQGEGAFSILKAVANYGDVPQIMNGTNASSLGGRDTNIRLAHFTIDGNRANNATGTGNAVGIYMVAVVNLLVEHMIVCETKGNAIMIVNASTAAVYPTNVHILHNVCFNVTGIGIYLTSALGAHIAHNVVFSTTLHGIGIYLNTAGALCARVHVESNEVHSLGSGSGSYGIIAGAVNTLIAYELYVTNNIVVTISGTGIGYANTDGLKLCGNIVRNVSLRGIEDVAGGSGSLARVEITHNVIIQAGGQGIAWSCAAPAQISHNTVEAAGTGDGSGGIGILSMVAGQVSHNIVDTVTGHGIACVGITNVSLVGNTVTGNNGSGLVLTNALQCAITGGVYAGNVAYGILEFGSANFNTIMGNSCRGNGSTGVAILGAQTINLGNQT